MIDLRCVVGRHDRELGEYRDGGIEAPEGYAAGGLLTVRGQLSDEGKSALREALARGPHVVLVLTDGMRVTLVHCRRCGRAAKGPDTASRIKGKVTV